MTVLLIDNYDSFTFMLKDYFEQSGASCHVYRNDSDLLNLDLTNYDAVVISPGPSTPAKSGLLMPFLKKIIHHKPVLGVCLGHQAIGELFGAYLVQGKKPVHGKKVEILVQHQDPVLEGLAKTFSVICYNSLVLQRVYDPLVVTASSASGEVMAIKHKSLPVWGIQFHPESCGTTHGIRIIRNFLDLLHQ